MDVSSITGNQTSAAASGTRLADDFDTFLTLLTTQLQNQDPLSPMDSNEFTAQLVQFSEVEQSIATNKNLEALVNLSLSSSTGAAVGYLGREVSAGGDEAALKNGKATWSYTLGGNAATTSLVVKDAGGSVIYQSEGARTQGSHTFVWDGRTADGGLARDGTYMLEVRAEDSAGNVISSDTSIKGKVTAVEIENGVPYLTVNGISLGLGQVQRIEPAEEPGEAPPAAPETP